MTQEQKELLLQDLCTRLPYGLKVLNKEEVITIKGYIPNLVIDEFGISHTVEDVKPYLFPLSSMTEEERQELSRLVNDDKLLTGDPGKTVCLHCGVVIDFHNSHHLDWRGLIPMGLAIDATDKNIY